MNALEQTFYAGVGLALKGKEKVEAAAKKFAAEQKMSADEGKKFVDKVVKNSEQAQKDFNKKIEEATKQTINKMGLASKKEVDALNSKVAKLEAELKAVKAAKPAAKPAAKAGGSQAKPEAKKPAPKK